jgi:hypothetical protein
LKKRIKTRARISRTRERWKCGTLFIRREFFLSHSRNEYKSMRKILKKWKNFQKEKKK